MMQTCLFSQGPTIELSGDYVFLLYRIDGVIVSVLVSSVVNRGFEPRPSQTKDNSKKKLYFVASPARSIKEKDQRWIGSESG